MKGGRRAVHRIPIVDAWVRIRVVGSTGGGILCRVCDSSPAGVGLASMHALDTGPVRIEVLTSSGQLPAELIEARVVRIDPDPAGGYIIGCSFE